MDGSDENKPPRQDPSRGGGGSGSSFISSLLEELTGGSTASGSGGAVGGLSGAAPAGGAVAAGARSGGGSSGRVLHPTTTSPRCASIGRTPPQHSGKRPQQGKGAGALQQTDAGGPATGGGAAAAAAAGGRAAASVVAGAACTPPVDGVVAGGEPGGAAWEPRGPLACGVPGGGMVSFQADPSGAGMTARVFAVRHDGESADAALSATHQELRMFVGTTTNNCESGCGPAATTAPGAAGALQVLACGELFSTADGLCRPHVLSLLRATDTAGGGNRSKGQACLVLNLLEAPGQAGGSAQKLLEWQFEVGSGPVTGAALGDGPSVAVATASGVVHLFRCTADPFAGTGAAPCRPRWLHQQFESDPRRALLVTLPSLGPAAAAAGAPPPLLRPGVAQGRQFVSRAAVAAAEAAAEAAAAAAAADNDEGGGAAAAGDGVTLLDAPPNGGTWLASTLRLPQPHLAAALRAACIIPASPSRLSSADDGCGGTDDAGAAVKLIAAGGLLVADGAGRLFAVPRSSPPTAAAAEAGAATVAAAVMLGARLPGPPAQLWHVPSAAHCHGMLAVLCSDLPSTLHLLSWPRLQPLCQVPLVGSAAVPRAPFARPASMGLSSAPGHAPPMPLQLLALLPAPPIGAAEDAADGSGAAAAGGGSSGKAGGRASGASPRVQVLQCDGPACVACFLAPGSSSSSAHAGGKQHGEQAAAAGGQEAMEVDAQVDMDRERGMRAVVASLQQRLGAGCEQVERLERTLRHKASLTTRAYALLQRQCRATFGQPPPATAAGQAAPSAAPAAAIATVAADPAGAGRGAGSDWRQTHPWQVQRLWAVQQGPRWAVRATLRVADGLQQQQLQRQQHQQQAGEEAAWRGVHLLLAWRGSLRPITAESSSRPAADGSGAVELCAWVPHSQVAAGWGRADAAPAGGNGGGGGGGGRSSVLDVYVVVPSPTALLATAATAAAAAAAAAAAGRTTAQHQTWQRVAGSLQLIGSVALGEKSTDAGPRPPAAAGKAAGEEIAAAATTDDKLGNVEMEDAAGTATAAGIQAEPAPALQSGGIVAGAAAAGAAERLNAAPITAAGWREASTWLLTCRPGTSVAAALGALQREAPALPLRCDDAQDGGSGCASPSAAGLIPAPPMPLRFDGVSATAAAAAGADAAASGVLPWPALAPCTAAVTPYGASHAEVTLSAPTWRQLEAGEACLAAIMRRRVPGVAAWERSPIGPSAIARLAAAAAALDDEVEASIALIEAELRARHRQQQQQQQQLPKGINVALQPVPPAGLVGAPLAALQLRTDAAVAAACST